MNELEMLQAMGGIDEPFLTGRFLGIGPCADDQTKYLMLRRDLEDFCKSLKGSDQARLSMMLDVYDEEIK